MIGKYILPGTQIVDIVHIPKCILNSRQALEPIVSIVLLLRPYVVIIILG